MPADKHLLFIAQCFVMEYGLEVINIEQTGFNTYIITDEDGCKHHFKC